MISPFLEIYKDGKLEAKAVKRYSFKNFETSSDFPLVKLSKNTVVKFDQERFKEKGEWVYHINLKIGEHAVNLKFTGTTKGFKYETDAESWTVALPKATVTGEITVNGKKMNVDGVGYHDHNWNYSLLTVMNYGKGWYWGKLMSKTLTISWAEVIKSADRAEILAILSQDGKGYIPTNVENIQFIPSKFIRNHGSKMPTEFTIKIDDVVDGVPIKVDVEMETKDIHYNKVAIFAPYWRYHVKARGYISLGDHKETINETQIMEFLKFS
jgi:predicted secreted hydrolase